MKNVDIYTDGCCKGNPGPGGWGAVLIYKQHISEISGGCKNTTNNQMEITGVIEAVKLLKEPCNLTIHTDSQYVVNSFEKGWLDKWVSENFKSSDGNDRPNTNLWRELLKLLIPHTYKFVWVRGHNGDKYNERCDRLANEAVQMFILETL